MTTYESFLWLSLMLAPNHKYTVVSPDAWTVTHVSFWHKPRTYEFANIEHGIEVITIGPGDKYDSFIIRYVKDPLHPLRPDKRYEEHYDRHGQEVDPPKE